MINPIKLIALSILILGASCASAFAQTTVRGTVKDAQGEPIIDNPDIVAPEGYSLVWNDEFDVEPKESGKWRFENWAPGRVNNELQRYVPGGELDGKKRGRQGEPGRPE